MRQIFSVILAAALVFGGALFMGGYFEGIEVTIPPEPIDPTGPGIIAPHEPAVGRGALWHCPDTQQFRQGKGGELFGDIDTDDIGNIEELEWSAALVSDYVAEDDEWLRTRSVICAYSVLEQEYHSDDRSFFIHSLDGYIFEIPFPKVDADIWKSTGWTDQRAEINFPAEFGVCYKSVKACQFRVLRGG